MGFIADDIRLPPDPKVDKKERALVPDLTTLEMMYLKDIIRGIKICIDSNSAYGRVLFGANSPMTKTNTEVKQALKERESLFRKILDHK